VKEGTIDIRTSFTKQKCSPNPPTFFIIFFGIPILWFHHTSITAQGSEFIANSISLSVEVPQIYQLSVHHKEPAHSFPPHLNNINRWCSHIISTGQEKRERSLVPTTAAWRANAGGGVWMVVKARGRRSARAPGPQEGGTSRSEDGEGGQSSRSEMGRRWRTRSWMWTTWSQTLTCLIPLAPRAGWRSSRSEMRRRWVGRSGAL